MNKNNKGLPVISKAIFAAAMLTLVIAGCGRDRDGPLPPPGTPPKPQAAHEAYGKPSASIQKAIFAVPSSAGKVQNGRLVIMAEHVIHT
jgi:predicted small lipoprotein YifL